MSSSISPTFPAQLFQTKVLCPVFFVLTCQVCTFWRKIAGAKAHKMSVKSTSGVDFINVHQEAFAPVDLS
jgi:hypothetical protein